MARTGQRQAGRRECVRASGQAKRKRDAKSRSWLLPVSVSASVSSALVVYFRHKRSSLCPLRDGDFAQCGQKTEKRVEFSCQAQPQSQKLYKAPYVFGRDVPKLRLGREKESRTLTSAEPRAVQAPSSFCPILSTAVLPADCWANEQLNNSQCCRDSPPTQTTCLRSLHAYQLPAYRMQTSRACIPAGVDNARRYRF